MAQDVLQFHFIAHSFGPPTLIVLVKEALVVWNVRVLPGMFVLVAVWAGMIAPVSPAARA